MIFVTVGNHDQGFIRLIKHLDLLAPKLKEEIIIQKGHTKYNCVSCECFDFAPSLDKYYKKARLIIVHAGIGTMLELLKNYKKPIIAVPRQFKFNEHINDHQVGMAQYFERKLGIKTVYNISDLDIKTLRNYKEVVPYNDTNLKKLQSFLKSTISKIKKQTIS